MAKLNMALIWSAGKRGRDLSYSGLSYSMCIVCLIHDKAETSRTQAAAETVFPNVQTPLPRDIHQTSNVCLICAEVKYGEEKLTL
jgi:hypothetical protein